MERDQVVNSVEISQVSKSLVERYDGKITIHSEAGQGACFTLWLRCEPLG